MKKTLTLLLLAITIHGYAQQNQPLPVDPNVRTGQLENGLTYYIRHNKLPENRSRLLHSAEGGLYARRITRLVGLLWSTWHLTGQRISGKDHVDYLQDNGIRFGVNINAYTSFDETVYYMSDIPTTNQNLMDSALLVLHDWSSAIVGRGKARKSGRDRRVAHQRAHNNVYGINCSRRCTRIANTRTVCRSAAST